MNKIEDERGADGLTVREAIARRTLLGLERLVVALRDDEMDFAAAFLAVKVLIEANLPFVDPHTKIVISQVQRKWEEDAERRREAQRELTRSRHSGFGVWS